MFGARDRGKAKGLKAKGNQRPSRAKVIAKAGASSGGAGSGAGSSSSSTKSKKSNQSIASNISNISNYATSSSSKSSSHSSSESTQSKSSEGGIVDLTDSDSIAIDNNGTGTGNGAAATGIVNSSGIIGATDPLLELTTAATGTAGTAAQEGDSDNGADSTMEVDEDENLSLEEREWKELVQTEYDKIIKRKYRKIEKDGTSAWSQNLSSVDDAVSVENRLWEEGGGSTWKCDSKSPENVFASKARIRVVTSAQDDLPTATKLTPLVTSIRTIVDKTAIPRMFDYVSTRHNFMVDDETTLLNLPYLGDDVVEHESSFLVDLLQNYEKVHDGEGELNNDQVFVDLVKALARLEKKKATLQSTTNNDGENNGVADEGSTADVGVKRRSTRSQNQLIITESPSKKVVLQTGMVITTTGGSDMETSSRIETPSMTVFNAISRVFPEKGKPEEIQKKFLEAYEKLEPGSVPASLRKIPNIDGPNAESLSADATMNSYHSLFCRRCFKYDCFRHCLTKDHAAPELTVKRTSGEELSLNDPCGPNCYLHLDAVSSIRDGSESTRNRNSDPRSNWSGGDQSMFRVLRKIYRSNFCGLSQILMTKSCKEVYYFALTEAEEIPKEVALPPRPVTPPVKDAKKMSTWRAYHKKRIQMKKDASALRTCPYTPCNHPGSPCDVNCPCFANDSYCEKFCLCNKSCMNRFLGCDCKGQCINKQCACHLAVRECDPDLCKQCGADQYDVQNINCRNVSIQRGLHKHILLAPSDVAGWGIFIKDSAEKNELISEYCGEIISQAEADRRGKVYDKTKCSFLFNLNDDYVVDATRKGNKIRFANHSLSPNCFAKVYMVNGDHRIGIFAKHSIQPGAELFFDYSYAHQDRMKYVGIERPKDHGL